MDFEAITLQGMNVDQDNKAHGRRLTGGWPEKRMWPRSMLVSMVMVTTVATDTHGDGLRSALCWRGANSLRPCYRHWNVTKKDSNLSHRNADLVEVTYTDPRRFKKLSNKGMDDNLALVQAAAMRLRAGAMEKGLYDNICMSVGLKYNAQG